LKNFALFCDQFLGWHDRAIYEEVYSLSDYSPTIFTRKTVNSTDYPWPKLHSLQSKNYSVLTPSSLIPALATPNKKFMDLLSSEDYEFIHVHYGENGLYASQYAKELKLKLVVTLHGEDVTSLINPNPYETKWRHYEAHKDQLFEKTDLFLTGSFELRELFMEQGCPQEKIRVYPQGIDIEKYKRNLNLQSSKGNRPALVVMKGSFEEQFGFRYGIKAFAVLAKRTNCNLVIIGDGPLEEDLVNLTKELEIQSKVKFVKPLSFDEENTLLSSASVAIIPSVVSSNQKREASARFIIEASARGIPVIATCHGRNSDAVEDGITGYIVPERDIYALADRMEHLVTSEERLKTFGFAARAKIEFQFDIQKSTKKLEGFFKWVVAKS
jgi:glycosyltransferase involved in cell wall biosynthesis